MYGSQIERLKRDSKELKHYMNRLEKHGKSDLVHHLRKKYEYLNTRIEYIQDEVIQRRRA